MISLPWVYALLSIAGAVPLSSLGSGSEQAHSSINLTNVPASGISGVLVPRWTELNHHEHEKRATVQTTEEQETVYDGGDGEKAHLKTELRGLIASRISSASKTSASPPPAEDPESDIVKQHQQHQQHQQFCDPQPQSLQIWKLANGYEMVGELVGMKEDTMTFRQQGSYFTWPKKAFMPSDVARASRMQQTGEQDAISPSSSEALAIQASSTNSVPAASESTAQSQGPNDQNDASDSTCITREQIEDPL